MANFKVTAASRQQRMRRDGGATTVYIAWLETVQGATGSVEVPVKIWEGPNLREFLQAEATKMDRAFDLVNGEE